MVRRIKKKIEIIILLTINGKVQIKAQVQIVNQLEGWNGVTNHQILI